MGNDCIIIDSWAGGGGQRGEWIRIMNFEDINSVLNELSTTTDIEHTNRLLNAYFIVPNSVYGNITNNVRKNYQSELLSVGAYNLTDWTIIMNDLLNYSKHNSVIINGGHK